MNAFFYATDLIRETWNGKSIARILSNWRIQERCRQLTGTIIDFGGGQNPSYERYWDIRPAKFIRTDADPDKHPDVVADLDKVLPFPENHADHAFLFSAIYILRDPVHSLRQIGRVLKPEGRLWLTSPFIFPENREPHDYVRFTQEGLEKCLHEAGFSRLRIEPVGGRFSAAMYILSSFIRPPLLRIPFYFAAIFFDALVPRRLQKEHPLPLGYFCVAKK